jgi:hemerythrin superfamily protein
MARAKTRKSRSGTRGTTSRTSGRARRPRRSSPSRRGSGRRTAGRGNESPRTARAGQGTDALSVLRRQHDEARKLFQALAEAQGPERRNLFQRLADALAAHSKVEEQLVYPQAFHAEGLAELALDSGEEHLIVKRLLADLLEKDLDEEVFASKCRVLELEVTRHLEEEEAALFPRLRRALGREKLGELGAEIERSFGELMSHEPRMQVPRELEAAPRLA